MVSRAARSSGCPGELAIGEVFKGETVHVTTTIPVVGPGVTVGRPPRRGVPTPGAPTDNTEATTTTTEAEPTTTDP